MQRQRFIFCVVVHARYIILHANWTTDPLTNVISREQQIIRLIQGISNHYLLGPPVLCVFVSPGILDTFQQLALGDCSQISLCINKYQMRVLGNEPKEMGVASASNLMFFFSFSAFQLPYFEILNSTVSWRIFL